MGYWADQLFRSQKPRQNGCPVSLIPPIPPMLAIAVVGWGIWEAVV